MDIRTRILNCFDPVVGIIPHEEEKFHWVCDDLDMIEVILKIEKEFNVTIDEECKKGVYDFEEVKDFVNWIIEEINKVIIPKT